MIKNKPEVIKQTKEIEERRAKDAASSGKIIMQDNSGNNKELSTPEVIEIIKGLQQENMELKKRHSGQIIMETPEGNRPLTTEETAGLIKSLQTENLSMKEQIKNMSMNQTQSDVSEMNTTNKQLIITDEDGCMEILDFDEINDFINVKIEKIKTLRKEQEELVVKSVEISNTKEMPNVDDSLKNNMDELKEDLKNTIKSEIEREMKSIRDTLNDEDNDKESENLYIEKNGKNVRMTNSEVYEIVQQQQQMINACKQELDKRTIYFNDESGEKIELTQEIFDYIVKKVNSQITKQTSDEDQDEDDVEIDLEECVDDDDSDEDSESSDNEENTEELNRLENTLNDSHGNNSSNINFTKS